MRKSDWLTWRRVLLLTTFLLLPIAGSAAEITGFRLAPDGEGHHLEARALIDAPLDDVWRVLTDYAALHQVSPRIIESELLSVTPDGVFRVRTLNRLCFLIFCRDLRHLQLIRELARGDFESTSDPEESDLAYGHARWRLFDQGGTTRLEIDFRFAMYTYSWVPSWVTNAVAGSVLKADAAELVQGIERTARAGEAETLGD
jgi:hypothetical protein